jgi:hypothetical protein
MPQHEAIAVLMLHDLLGSTAQPERLAKAIRVMVPVCDRHVPNLTDVDDDEVLRLVHAASEN